MSRKVIQRKVRHQWFRSQAGVSATVRRKSDQKTTYRRVIQDVRHSFRGEFRVTIDVEKIVALVVDHATRTTDMQATLFRGLVQAECIQRQDLGLEVIPLPLDEDEELAGDGKAE
jgi:hypothetical protein